MSTIKARIRREKVKCYLMDFVFMTLILALMFVPAYLTFIVSEWHWYAGVAFFLLLFAAFRIWLSNYPSSTHNKGDF